MNKHFRQDFFKLKNKLEQGENFAFSRYSDGEMFILQNKKLVLDNGLIQIENKKQKGGYKPADFKNFNPEIHEFYQKKLVESFKHRQLNYFKGISCSCCVGKDNFDWQIDLHGGDDEFLTWANLWVNGNYHLFIEQILPIFQNKKCVFVGHTDAVLDKFLFFVNDFRVGYNAMVNDYDKIKIMIDWIDENKINNHVFLFSASTFSNLAIYELFKKYPNNTYIDIGTTLAYFMNMPIQRGYLDAYWNNGNSQNLKKICIWN